MKPWIEHVVEEKLAEIVGDPDSDLRLKNEVRVRLEKSKKNSLTSSINAKEAAKKLGLRW